MNDTQDPARDVSGYGAIDYQPDSAQPSGALEALLAREEARLLAIPGVVSVGIGLGPAGTEAFVLGVIDAGVAARLPSDIERVPVVINVTGSVDALRRR